MEKLRRAFGRLDRWVFHVERALLVLSLGMMTVLVGLDVTQRTFSRPISRTASVLLAFTPNAPPETQAFVVDRLAPAVFGLLALAFLVLGVHARRAGMSKAPPRVLVSLGLGAALWVGLALAVDALLWLFPSSVPGAQRFALGFMLWAGMLGASLATRARRHIALDTVVKKLEGRTQRWFLLMSGVLTAAFCAFLGYLGALQLTEQLSAWSAGEGVGVYDALPIPTWVATLAVPTTFFVMAARFLGIGVHDFVWGPPKGGLDAHGVDLEALEKQAPGAEATP